MKLAALVAPWVLACVSCGAPAKHLCPCHALAGTDGAQHALTPHGDERFSVLVFYAASCSILQAHAPRLCTWAERYRRAGVRFYAIDSEVSAGLADDARAVVRGGWSFPMLIDAEGNIAHALGAEFAGYAVVLDHNGNVQYAGGLDSDRTVLTGDAQMYLANALDDLIAGQVVRRRFSKALGCALRMR